MKRSTQVTGWSALAALTFVSLGCTLTADPVRVAEPVVVGGPAPTVVYADVEAAPVEVDIATYPQTYYGGHAFYLYRDQWYYQDGDRWAYYRQEPPELYRQRGYVQQARPSERHEEARPAERHEAPQVRPAQRPAPIAPQPRRPAHAPRAAR